MQRNVFKESIYFNVYGTIIEVPYKNLENTHFKNFIGYHDVVKYSDGLSTTLERFIKIVLTKLII